MSGVYSLFWICLLFFFSAGYGATMTIEDEGLACVALAIALPGLQSLTGIYGDAIYHSKGENDLNIESQEN